LSKSALSTAVVNFGCIRVLDHRSLKILGVNRRTGGRIRARHRQQTAPPVRSQSPPRRYLSRRERPQIADLLRLGLSMRQIAVELGRRPSTVKRELDRHRDEQGRYLPQNADHTVGTR